MNYVSNGQVVTRAGSLFSSIRVILDRREHETDLEKHCVPALTPAMRESWDRDGFFFLRGFAEATLLERMEARVVELVRAAAAGESIGDAYVTKELSLAEVAVNPEDEISKLFRIHRDERRTSPLPGPSPHRDARRREPRRICLPRGI